MRPRAPTRPAIWCLLGILLAGAARAQEIEPRAYSNAPVGTNFLIGGYAFTRGNLSFDSSLPISDAHFQTSSLVLGYARSLDIFGMSGKVDAAVPFSWLSGTAQLAGAPIERVVDGFGDARFRLSVNFFGAPALTEEEFASYSQDLILGASFQVTAPVGQYDASRAVNLGMNRWTFRPELGASQAIGPLTLELKAGATFFTDNTNFYGGTTRSQDPIYAVQGNAIYSFGGGYWASVDVTWFTGGRTTIGGEANDDRLSNWRAGATLSIPLGPRYSVRIYGSRGVAARTGNNYDLMGLALRYRWGGGL